MRALPIVAIALVLAAFGCKPNQESQVPGTWTGPPGASFTFKSDKTYSAQGMGITEAGTWEIDSGDLVVTPLTVDGQPVAQVKKLAQSRLSGQSSAMAKAVDDIDKPAVMTLSSDGKTMTTDKSRDKNGGPGITLTKQG